MGAGYHGGFGFTIGEKDRQQKNHCKQAVKSQIVFASIEYNVKAMVDKFPLTNGKFGVKGKNCQVIYCEEVIESSQEFYNLISNGGTESKLHNGHGVKSVLDDGTIIVYRQFTSTTNSPAIDITKSPSSSVKNQKIHFVEKLK